MRFISGKYKGKKIEGYNIVGTRPTMNRIKESLIATIQPYIKNGTILDLFAGTGALGLEALSNGAKVCYFVDQNYKCIQSIQNTIKQNEIKELAIYLKMDYQKALSKCKEEKLKFDVIFLDPPYETHYISSALSFIKTNALLKEDGIVVCEYEKKTMEADGFCLWKEKKYGSKYIEIYKSKQN